MFESELNINVNIKIETHLDQPSPSTKVTRSQRLWWASLTGPESDHRVFEARRSSGQSPNARGAYCDRWADQSRETSAALDGHKMVISDELIYDLEPSNDGFNRIEIGHKCTGLTQRQRNRTHPKPNNIPLGVHCPQMWISVANRRRCARNLFRSFFVCLLCGRSCVGPPDFPAAPESDCICTTYAYASSTTFRACASPRISARAKPNRLFFASFLEHEHTRIWQTTF